MSIYAPKRFLFGAFLADTILCKRRICIRKQILRCTISLTDAIANQMISIDDMIKKAWEQEEKDSCIIYKFENYQIVVGDKECTIGALK